MQLGNYWYTAQQGELRALDGDECQRLRVVERRLLNVLLQHREQVVSRYQLLQSLGSTNERLLARGITRLQQKLDDPHGQLLERIANEGYILHQRVQRSLSVGRFGGLRISWRHYCAIIATTLLVMTLLWHHLPVELPDLWPYQPTALSLDTANYKTTYCHCLMVVMRIVCRC
jgi:DNA-binding winged helix-turn-helix (wHTH) protein